MLYYVSIGALLTACDFTPDVPYAYEIDTYSWQDCDPCLVHEAPRYTVECTKVTAPDYLSQVVNAKLDSMVIDQIIDINQTAKTIEDALETYVNNTLTAYPESSEFTKAHELSIATSVLYASKHILSIGIDSYIMAGGAHGNSTFQFLNVNAQTGALLTLDEITEDKEGLYAFAKAYFIKTHGSIDQFWFLDDTFTYSENIGFTESGILFFYNTYEIATYAEGSIELTLPWDNVEDFLLFR